MAFATKKVIPQPQYTVMLEMSQQEAEALCFLLAIIGGDPVAMTWCNDIRAEMKRREAA